MDIQSQVQNLLDEAVASGAQSACQCCVYDHGEKIVDAFAGSYEKGGERKIDSRSLFPICSTGKAFLATAGLRFLDRGLFALDDRISKLWPELTGDGKEEITFREVFGHRAGLVPEFPELPREEMSDWNAMARRCAEAQPIFPHGTRAAYLALTFTWYLGHPLTLLSVREAGIPNGPPGREGETTYGLGLRLWGPSDNRGRILAHSGFGGSEGWIDLERDLALGYTCACEATARRPPYDLRGRLYEIVGVTPNMPRPPFHGKNDKVDR